MFVLVKKWIWILDIFNNLYLCDCGLMCLWINFDVFLDRFDVYLYELVILFSRVCVFYLFFRFFEEYFEIYLFMYFFGLFWLILLFIIRV